MNENQTTYPTGAQDEEEIDLVALMVTLLHKLKPILLTAVVCAVIAGGLAGERSCAAVLFRQKIRLLMKRLWLSISRKRRIMSLLCSSTSWRRRATRMRSLVCRKH